jgi:hypothetical protein
MHATILVAARDEAEIHAPVVRIEARVAVVGSRDLNRVCGIVGTASRRKRCYDAVGPVLEPTHFDPVEQRGVPRAGRLCGWKN